MLSCPNCDCKFIGQITQIQILHPHTITTCEKILRHYYVIFYILLKFQYLHLQFPKNISTFAEHLKCITTLPDIALQQKFMTKFILRTVCVLMILLIYCTDAFASQQFIARDRLLYFSEQFANEVLHSPENVAEIRKVHDKSTPDSTVYRTLRKFGRGMFERGEQNKAFQYFKQALDILDSEKKLVPAAKEFKSYCYLMLGAATDEVGMSQLSLDYYLKGLKICEEQRNHRDIAKFYNNIGVCCIRANDAAKAENYFKRALQLNTKYGIKQEMSINYTNLAQIEEMRGNMDLAIEYGLKAIQCLNEKAEPYDYYSMQSAIGSLYVKKNEIHMARTWLENAYKHQKSLNYRNSLFYTCLEFMKLAGVTGNAADFERYKSEAERLANESKNSMVMLDFYRTAGDYYKSKGDSEKAYEMTQKYIATQDSAYQAENKSRMEQNLNYFNLEKKTKEYESSISNWNPLWVLAICGSISLVLLGLLIWVIRTMRRSEKVRKEKAQTDAMLAELREQHLQDEIRRNEEAARELNDNQRSLTAITLEKIKTNQTIDEVIQKVRQVLLSISARDKENQLHLKSIVAKLSSLDNDVNWNEFQMYFGKVHPGFYQRLEEAHSELTPKDRRLCALIALGLSTKEIASLTFREVRSVETSRNRLRKKMQIASDVNLEDYLLRFTMSGEAVAASE